jgi:hypothetical protein
MNSNAPEQCSLDPLVTVVRSENDQYAGLTVVH